MRKIILVGLIGAVSIAFTACNNGAYDANPNANNSGSGNPLNPNNPGGGGSSSNSLLTTGKWKISAYTLGSTDMLALVDDCEKDDIFTFNSDLTITRDEGATKCSASDPQTKNDGIWSISGTKFSSTSGSTSAIWDIITLDNSTFKISAEVTGFGTGTQTWTRP